MAATVAWRRVLVALVVAAALAIGSAVRAEAPADIPSLKQQVAEFEKAENFTAAYPVQAKLATAVEAEETRTLGKPGQETADALSTLAFYALFARQFGNALAASERAHALDVGSLFIETNRAHGLLFLGRTKEALALYLTYKGQPISLKTDKLWEEAIAEDFAAFRKAGLENSKFDSILATLGMTKDRHAIDLNSMFTELKQLEQNRQYDDLSRQAEKTVAAAGQRLGEDHTNYATALSWRAQAFKDQGKFPEAEPLYKRALAIRETALGADHPLVASALNNLASLYQAQGRYPEAEPLFKRSLAIRETALGADHPDVASALNNLAGLYQDQGRYPEAEPLFKRALAIRETALGPDHPDVAAALNNLALLYRDQGRYPEAEPLFKRALAIDETALGPDHPDVATDLNNLAELYRDQGRYPDAEPLFKRSLAIRETALGPDHPDVAQSLNNLAALYRDQGRYPEAEPLFKRALAIDETALGADHPLVASALNNLASLYQAQGRYPEAEPLYKRSLAIRETALGPDHPDVATALNNLALLYRDQGRYPEAEPLFKRALAIRETALGPDHPDVAAALNNLALLYRDQGRYPEAEPLFKRALAIDETALGPDHPDVATALNNLAWLALAQRDWAGAAEYWRQATALLQRRAERGLADANGGSSKGEAQRNGWYFEGLVKTTYRLATPDHDALADRAAETFETAQWSQGSEAAASLAQMATRSAGDTPELAALVRERQDLVGEWQLKDRSLIAAKSEPPAKRRPDTEKVLADQLATIDTRRSEIDARLTKDFPGYTALASPKPISVADVQANLRDDEALVLTLDTSDGFKPLPEETFVWVVTKSDVRWVRSELGTAALRLAVGALRCGLDRAGNWQWSKDAGRWLATNEVCKSLAPDGIADYAALPFDVARAYALYHGLFGAAEDLIKGKHLIIVPSGALTQLPFQVLVTALPSGSTVGEVVSEVGRLGAELGPLSDEDRKSLALSAPSGVKVVRPAAGGPAEVAGVLAGDSLLALDQDPVLSVPDAVAKIQALGPGHKATLKIVRDGQPLDLPVTLGTFTVKEWKPLLFSATSGQQTDWLINAHAITVLPAASSLKALRRDAKPSAAPEPFLGFGDPVLEGGSYCSTVSVPDKCPDEEQVAAKPLVARLAGALASVGFYFRGGLANVTELKKLCPLPDTAHELQCVAKSLGAPADSVVLGPAMTEAALKKMPLDRYRVLHFATHGLLAGEMGTLSTAQAEPALVMTPPAIPSEEDDGLLTASEIASLKLDADWVVMSACNTAAGGADSAEALSGLARAFFYAGARAMLVSHWPVNSYAATMLTSRTFAELKREPAIGRAEALRRAMLALMADPRRPWAAHPSVWAPFVVVGEGGAGR